MLVFALGLWARPLPGMKEMPAKPAQPAPPAAVEQVQAATVAARLDSDAVDAMALSPDGKLLVYAASVSGGRTNLFIRPLDELTARAIPATEGATTPFFSPAGRWPSDDRSCDARRTAQVR